MKKIVSIINLFLFSSILFPSGQAKAQLATEYRRNGEVYFLVGEQNNLGHDNPIKGIYRMNNPETEVVYPVGGYRYIYGIDNTIGFTVTLDREIYTYTKTIDGNANKYMYRQVADDVDWLQADYGYHAYYHSDHRNFDKGKGIWRSNTNAPNSNYDSGLRKIRNNSSGWTSFRSLGLGTKVGTWAQVQQKCPSYVYRELTGNLKVPVVATASWYELEKSKSRWYTCWSAKRTEGTSNRNKHSSGDSKLAVNYFYGTIGENEELEKHDYKLVKWTSSDVTTKETSPTYNPGTNVFLGSTAGVSLGRQVLAGCLDGCGGFSGSMSPQSAPLASASVAFQPAPTGSSTGNRSYFYSRVITSSDYTLNSTVAPTYIPNKNALKNLDTYRIGISLQNKDKDYLYGLGDTVIAGWYKDATGQNLTNTKIKSASVSNQWEQIGGIIYAYDSAHGLVYEFVRDETQSSAKDKIKEYRAINVKDKLINGLGLGSSENELDDVAADGYGNLYYTVSQPAGDKTIYKPKEKFQQNDCKHFHVVSIDEAEDKVDFTAVFEQEYRKTIGKYDIQTEKCEEVNRLVYAYEVYSIPVTVTTDLYSKIRNIPNDWYSVIKTYYDTKQKNYNNIFVAGARPTGSKLNKNMFTDSSGACTCATITAKMAIDYENPGQTQLAVINIPTPPEVKHFGPYKVSYLDICGPYNTIPKKDSNGTGQRIADLSWSNLERQKLYFFQVENYPYKSGTHSQDPKTNLDYDQDTKSGGFISTIKYPNPESDALEPGKVRYQWRLWQVSDNENNNVCHLLQDENSSTHNYAFWNYAGGKFILCCRVYYEWYDYDSLAFGATVADRERVKKSSVAWASREGSANAFASWKEGGPVSNLFDNATATERLNEIMDMPEFSFMKAVNKPKDIDGNIINYKNKILTNTGSDYEFWAMQPIITTKGKIPQPSQVCAVERCDQIVKKDGSIPKVSDYIYKTGSNSYWSLPESSNNCFTIEEGKEYYWRMAIASQSKIFCDISKSTKYDKSKMNQDDFNMVAYLLSSPTLPDGKKNDLYMNGDPEAQFFPEEAGSCWWYESTDSEGNKHNDITCTIGINFIVPPNEQKSKQLGEKDSEGKIIVKKDLSDYIKNPSASTIWEKYRPIYATMTADVLPITDPLVGTITVTIQRSFCFNMVPIDKDTGIRGQASPVGPIPLTLTAQASIRVIDTQSPKIVYSETPNINLFGITGRALTKGDGPSGTKPNPEYVQFTLSDNNAWEAGSVNGVTLLQHVKNYQSNFGSEACASYTAGSTKLESLRSTSYEKGIKRTIEDLMDEGQKTSHLNYKPMFSKQAVDTRFIFETANYSKKDKDTDFDGSVTVDKADRFKYTLKISGNYNSGVYERDESIFDDDDSEYAYNPSIRTSGSGKLLRDDPIIKSTEQEIYSQSTYKIKLTDIKMKNGENKVPENYANNTPGYKPYKFYVRSTDCSGNYTYVPVSGKITRNKNDYYLPLNIALHVKDDIPPIPYGYLKEYKNNDIRTFPQKTDSYSFVNVNPFEDDNNSWTTVIATNTTNNIPTYIGSNWNNEFLRKEVWVSNDNDGFITDSGSKFKVLYSLYPNATNAQASNIGWSKNGKIANTKLVNQLKKGVSPGYVEENVECDFKVFTSDNAGNSVATLSYVYNTSFTTNQGNWSWSAGHSNGYASSVFNNPGLKEGSISYGVGSSTAVFVAPLTSYPIIIPIVITAEDDAKDWDYYRTTNTPNENSIGDVNSIFNDKNKVDGELTRNKRRINTSLVIMGSNTDIRTLDKTIKNESPKIK